MGKRAEELFSLAEKLDEGAFVTFAIDTPREHAGLVAVIPVDKEGRVEEAINGLFALRKKWHDDDARERYPENLVEAVGVPTPEPARTDDVHNLTYDDEPGDGAEEL
jgi:hypothetical protein